MNYRKKINEIYEHLVDEESKKIFDARINYMVNKCENKFKQCVYKKDDVWRCRKVEYALKEYSLDEIIIYGSGNYGRKCKEALELCNYKVSYFLDGDVQKQGKMVEGVKVIAPIELLKHENSVVIVASVKFREEMLGFLVENNIDEKRIVVPIEGYLLAVRGQQYFDVFLPEDDEVFIDVGTFDGATTIDFIKWTGERYKKIYMLEPLKNMYEHLSNSDFGKKDNIEIYNNAAWNKKETLNFNEKSTSSRIVSNGTACVNGIEIDEIIKEEKVTFIKMDIEGSELKALEGARKTIEVNTPKLAISIYHKLGDVLEIAAYLLEIVPEYKFCIRHYSSGLDETVLYAYI